MNPDIITSLLGSLNHRGSERACCPCAVCKQSRGWRDGGGLGAHPAGPVDQVIQLGHHILAPAAGK